MKQQIMIMYSKECAVSTILSGNSGPVGPNPSATRPNVGQGQANIAVDAIK